MNAQAQLRTIDQTVTDLKEDIWDFTEIFSRRVEFQKQENKNKFPCSGACAIGYKMGSEIGVVVRKLNTDCPSYWSDNTSYSNLAGTECFSVLDRQGESSDSKEVFFAQDPDVCVCYIFLSEWNAWVAIAFAGLTSPNCREIAYSTLAEFFMPKE